MSLQDIDLGPAIEGNGQLWFGLWPCSFSFRDRLVNQRHTNTVRRLLGVLSVPPKYGLCLRETEPAEARPWVFVDFLQGTADTYQDDDQEE
jgi:hypothetical protein